eukprot:Gb_04115 [translate_table: standard]
MKSEEMEAMPRCVMTRIGHLSVYKWHPRYLFLNSRCETMEELQGRKSGRRMAGVIVVVALIISSSGRPAAAQMVTECLVSLNELRPCTRQLGMFFLLATGPSSRCCRSVRRVNGRCWPMILTSFGFPSSFGDRVRGFCLGKSGGKPKPSPGGNPGSGNKPAASIRN